jgi:propanol-preferring alcohol dehydrogenase
LWEGGYEGPDGQFMKTTDRGVKYLLTPDDEVARIIVMDIDDGESDRKTR